MVGSLAAAKNRFLNPAEEASAHFLFPRDGIPTQMVDSDDVAWHSGDHFSNLHFHGFEFEGGAPGNLSEPLTENQIEWGIKITRWLRDDHNSPQIYVRRETLWEHNEVQATACPSGRIPWERLIDELSEPIEEDDMSKHIHSPSKVGMELFGFKRELPNDKEHQAIHAMGYKDTPITDAQWHDLVNFPFGGGSGLTLEETVAANQEAARRGTG